MRCPAKSSWEFETVKVMLRKLMLDINEGINNKFNFFKLKYSCILIVFIASQKHAYF